MVKTVCKMLFRRQHRVYPTYILWIGCGQTRFYVKWLFEPRIPSNRNSNQVWSAATMQVIASTPKNPIDCTQSRFHGNNDPNENNAIQMSYSSLKFLFVYVVTSVYWTIHGCHGDTVIICWTLGKLKYSCTSERARPLCSIVPNVCGHWRLWARINNGGSSRYPLHEIKVKGGKDEGKNTISIQIQDPFNIILNKLSVTIYCLSWVN